MKKILITGCNGFIGKNLVEYLKAKKIYELYLYDVDSKVEDLELYTKDCDFIFHIAGINRPLNEKDFITGNVDLTDFIISKLKKYNNNSPILITSSIQAKLENTYGSSKKQAEDIIFNYQNEMDTDVYVYRLPNVFGKWCRPNYNSVIATFCNNIANDLEITINDSGVELELVYIDDVVLEFCRALDRNAFKQGEFCFIPESYKVKLGYIVDRLNSFKNMKSNFTIPNLMNSFEKKLYSTYTSYFPKSNFSYLPKMNVDDRGSFTELLKSVEKGQISVNISKPGIVKGNHWHNTKTEKFIVVSGKGVIRFRKIGTSDIYEYFVSGEKIEIVDIPCGYTHNIENLGSNDMVTIMWCNECFDPNNPDTYFEPVEI